MDSMFCFDLKLPKLQTCLSPYVQKLITENTCSQRREPCALDRNGLLDFDFICTKLPAEGLENGLVDYFTTCVTKLAPMFHSVEDFLSDEKVSMQERYSGYLHWTGHSDHLLELWDMMKSRDDIEDVTVLLVTTAILERSLGNVYLIEGPEPCPSMLKDLLASSHLKNMLGSHVIQVLRILIGPPTSLNIRNVVWHGFPFPGEIPRRCIWFIMLLVPSIGQILHSKHVGQIRCREPVCFPQVELISDCTVLTNKEWLAIVAKTRLVSWDTELFWKKVKQFYEDQRYSYCASLLLYYLEQSLRRVFAIVNDCEDRILTAEATTLYTTFDEILDFKLPDSSENKLCQCVSSEIIEIMMDHLHYQHGPRVRDRLSHGEACWNTFPWQLANNLATVAIALSAMFVPKKDKTDGLITKVFRDISEYKVQFHRIAVLKKKITECCLKAAGIDGLVTFTPDLLQRQSTAEYPRTDCQMELTEALQKACTTLSEKWTYNSCQPDILLCLGYSTCSEFSFCMTEILEIKINTLYRENQSQVTSTQFIDREGEILTVLDHITTECLTVLNNVQDFVVLRQNQLHSKQLRSRQRENFKKFLSCFPSFVTVANMCSYICCWQLYHLDLLKHHHCYPSKIRFWKKNLQFCENLRTCSQADKNKWSEGQDLISHYTSNLQTNILTQLMCTHDNGNT